MARMLALALALLPASALAQDAQKFNARELEKEFAPLPVFSPKQGVVDHEVVVSRDRSRESAQAVYVVRADLKKVLEFYSSKLTLKPKKLGDEALGTVKYIFAPKPKLNEKEMVIATVWQSDDGQGVQIALLHRAITEEDPVAPAEL